MKIQVKWKAGLVTDAPLESTVRRPELHWDMKKFMERNDQEKRGEETRQEYKEKAES